MEAPYGYEKVVNKLFSVIGAYSVGRYGFQAIAYYFQCETPQREILDTLFIYDLCLIAIGMFIVGAYYKQYLKP